MRACTCARSSSPASIDRSGAVMALSRSESTDDNYAYERPPRQDSNMWSRLKQGSRPAPTGRLLLSARSSVRRVLLDRQIPGVLGESKNVDGVDLACHFVGHDGGVGRNRNDH